MSPLLKRGNIMQSIKPHDTVFPNFAVYIRAGKIRNLQLLT